MLILKLTAAEWCHVLDAAGTSAPLLRAAPPPALPPAAGPLRVVDGDACTRAAWCCRASLLLPVALSIAATAAAAPQLTSASEARGGSHATDARPLAASKAHSRALPVALPWRQICCVCSSRGEYMCEATIVGWASPP